MLIDSKGYETNNEKLAKRGRGIGHVTYFSNFGTPNISGMAENTNVKFRTLIDRKGYETKNEKMAKRGVAYVT